MENISSSVRQFLYIFFVGATAIPIHSSISHDHENCQLTVTWMNLLRYFGLRTLKRNMSGKVLILYSLWKWTDLYPDYSPLWFVMLTNYSLCDQDYHVFHQQKTNSNYNECCWFRRPLDWKWRRWVVQMLSTLICAQF